MENNWSVLVYGNSNKQKVPFREEGFKKWHGWLERSMFQLEEEAMRRDPANYRPLCVAKTGFFSDHGVLVCKDKHTRDFLLRSIPDVAGPGSGTTKAVPGVDGHFVKGFPVEEEGPTVILKLRYPKEILEAKRPIQEVLNLSLVKSGITGGNPATEKAFRGGIAFYVDHAERDLLCIKATPDLVAVLTTERSGCPAGHLYAGLECRQVWYKQQKLTKDTQLAYGHNLLPPPAKARQAAAKSAIGSQPAGAQNQQLAQAANSGPQDVTNLLPAQPHAKPATPNQLPRL